MLLRVHHTENNEQLITPKDEEQQSELVSLLEEMGISFESEGDSYWPVLDEKLREYEL